MITFLKIIFVILCIIVGFFFLLFQLAIIAVVPVAFILEVIAVILIWYLVKVYKKNKNAGDVKVNVEVKENQKFDEINETNKWKRKSFSERYYNEFNETDRKVFNGMIIFILIMLLILPFLIQVEEEEEVEETSSSETSVVVDEVAEEEIEEEETEEIVEEIKYISVTVDQLEEALDNNAAAAKAKYINQYVAVTGRLSTIDSDLKYIYIRAINAYDFIGINCQIESEEQKNTILQLNTDDIVIVKGKITIVGEVLGYSLDIIEISKK